MSGIPYIDLFGGIGGFKLGIQGTMGKATCEWYCDNDVHATAIYNHNFREDWKPTDIRDVRVEDIPDHRLLCAGFPCFPKGTPVVTDTGFKPIEEISAGDRVLTHTGEFRDVEAIKQRDYTGMMVTLTPKYGWNPVTATEEHPVLVRKPSVRWNHEKQGYRKHLLEPAWIPIKDVVPGDHICIPRISQEGHIPTYTYEHGINKSRIDIRTLDLSNEDIWFIIGFYIANGWYEESRLRRYPAGPKRVKSQRVVLACNPKQVPELSNRLNALGMSFTPSDERTVTKLHVINRGLRDYLEDNAGKGAENKHFPTAFPTLPRNLLRALVDGYVFGDGHINEKQHTINATTVSKQLAHDLQYALTILYGYPPSITWCKRPKTCIIEGRTVNQKDSYQIRLRTQRADRIYAVVEDSQIWIPVKDVDYEQTDGSIKVWNLEVGIDNSYTAWAVAVHNCQSHSWAGLRQGFCDPRGQLFFEIERIIRHHQPEVILLENVKGLLSSDRGRVFARIIDTLRDCGYVGEWCCVNSTAFVPQNRERIYIIGYLGGEPRGAILPFADRNGEPYQTCMEAQEKRKRVWGYPANAIQQRDYKSGAMQFVVQPRPCLTKNRWGKEPNGRYFGDVGEPMFSLTTQNNKGVCIQRSVRPATCACITPERQQKRQNGRRFKDAGEPMFTLTANDVHGVLLHDGLEYIIRKLTPLEYDRLQGFPDNWTAFGSYDGVVKPVSKSQRYRVCGNAVSVPAISAIARQIQKVLT